MPKQTMNKIESPLAETISWYFSEMGKESAKKRFKGKTKEEISTIMKEVRAKRKPKPT